MTETEKMEGAAFLQTAFCSLALEIKQVFKEKQTNRNQDTIVVSIQGYKNQPQVLKEEQVH